MNDELRAAAETLRGWIADGTFNWQKSHDRTDHVTGPILDAYLAEHLADDDMPITQEWLLGVGFEKDELKDKHFNLKYTSMHGEDWLVLIDDEEWIAEFDCNGQWPNLLTTRGDLRRLCAALGVELKDGQAAQT